MDGTSASLKSGQTYAAVRQHKIIVRIDNKVYHQRHSVTHFTHASFRQQVVARSRVHSFRIADVGSIDVEDEVAEGRQGQDPEILLLHEPLFLRRA